MSVHPIVNNNYKLEFNVFGWAFPTPVFWACWEDPKGRQRILEEGFSVSPDGEHAKIKEARSYLNVVPKKVTKWVVWESGDVRSEFFITPLEEFTKQLPQIQLF